MKSYNFANDDQAEFLTLETRILLVPPQRTTLRPLMSAEYMSHLWAFKYRKREEFIVLNSIQLDNHFDHSKISATTVSSRSLNKEKVALPEVGEWDKGAINFNKQFNHQMIR